MIREKTLYIIKLTVMLFLVLPYGGISQVNLIPNNSFEDTLGCPFNVSGMYGEQIYFLENWFPAAESPDYLNSCSNSQVNVPNSGFGYQYARSGQAYVGFYTIRQSNFIPNYREYIGVQLNQTLSIGTKYYFRGYIAAAYGGVQNMRYFSNNIGVLLSKNYFESQQNPLIPNNTPTGNFDSILTDTTNWVPFQFSFIADSSYEYLYLGNFYDNINTDSILPYGFTSAQGAYYFMDDLCLSVDSNFCETILSLNNQKEDPFIIYPNPTTTHLFFNNVKQSQMLFIYDLIGRQIFSHYLKKEDSSLEISNLPAGNYYIKMENPKFKSVIFQKH